MMKFSKLIFVLAVCLLTGCTDDTSSNIKDPTNEDPSTEDPNKQDPNKANCSLDDDGDGIKNCEDICPNVATQDMVDSDNDGKYDCEDECPNNPKRSKIGICGCDWNMSQDLDEYDTDSDGIPDCKDICKDDPENKDSDGDGTLDCKDECPDNPDKTHKSETCGCGTDYVDFDNKIVCEDQCPDDPNKATKGACGCGIPETDSDGDGVSDCIDVCPQNVYRSTDEDVTTCGCDWLHPTKFDSNDFDYDKVVDCKDKLDRMLDDGGKTEPGICGFGIPDIDSDGDGTLDCKDVFPYSPCTKDSSNQLTVNGETIYCIRTAQEFYNLRKLENNGTLSNISIHILNDINLLDISEFFYYDNENNGRNNYCTITQAEVNSRNSLLGSLNHVTVRSADSKLKTIASMKTYIGSPDCPLPYPLFNKIDNSVIERLALQYNVSGYKDGEKKYINQDVSDTKAIAALANEAVSSQFKSISLSSTIKTESTASNIGGLIATAKDCQFINTSPQTGYISPTINAPLTTNNVGGMIGNAENCTFTLSSTNYIKINAELAHNTGGLVGNASNCSFSAPKANKETDNIFINMSHPGDPGSAPSGYTPTIDLMGVSSSIVGGNNIGGLIGQGNNIQIYNTSLGVSLKASNTKTAGGLIGLLYGADNSFVNIYNHDFDTYDFDNKNRADIVGGLIGEISSSTNVSFDKIILMSRSITANQYAGGLIGSAEKSVKLNLTNILNFQNTSIEAKEIAGGLIGKIDTGFSINGLINIANQVKSDDKAGGIIGQINSTTNIDLQNISSVSQVESSTNNGGLLASYIDLADPNEPKIKFNHVVLTGNIDRNTNVLVQTLKSNTESVIHPDSQSGYFGNSTAKSKLSLAPSDTFNDFFQEFYNIYINASEVSTTDQIVNNLNDTNQNNDTPYPWNVIHGYYFLNWCSGNLPTNNDYTLYEDKDWCDFYFNKNYYNLIYFNFTDSLDTIYFINSFRYILI